MAEVALTAVERLDPPPIPTVIVLDCQMPGLSGLLVAERVPAPNARQIQLFTAFLDADPLAASQRPRHPIRTQITVQGPSGVVAQLAAG
jgi:CheY-like chemotaxis protein